MHLVIMTRQIGHYHNARYLGAVPFVDRLTVISTASQGGFAEFLAKDTGGYDVVRLFEERASYDAAVSSGRLVTAVESALAELAPDALAVSGWSNPESMAVMRWGRTNNCPMIMMSESQADDADRSFVRELVKKRLVSLCDAALVGGPPHADYIAHLGIAEPQIHMGYNAVDNDYFTEGAAKARQNATSLRADLNLPSRYILASARFIEKKNLPALVKAYAAAVQKVGAETPDLVILGDGEKKASILAAAHTDDVADRVHLHGFKGYDLLPAYYGLAEGFTHVSTVEQWGLVVNEAMAAGLPVIVSEPCGVGRTVIEDGVSGLIVKPDASSITTALTQLFQMTAEERSEMGLAASKAIAEWGPNRFGAGMKAAIESASTAPLRGRPAPWDAALLSHMEKRVVEQVA